MSTEYRDRDAMIGVVERRWSGVVEEFRKDKATGQIILEGYASTFDPYDVNGGPDCGGWVEQLSTRAFDQTLSEQPDVQLLINHAGTPLARTKSGTMKLSVDGHGLRVWASLDPDDPDVKGLLPKMRRGDMDEMSFAFRVNDQDWDRAYSHRTIQGVSLEKGDVSVVNYGANPATKAVLADAVGMLAQLSTSKDLTEVRELVQGALNRDQIKRAMGVLSSIAGPPEHGLGTIGPAAEEGVVPYADPGYKQDGKKRYPLPDLKRAQAAWSYINMTKNQKGYTAGQVKSIKQRIESALRAFGAPVSGEKTMSHIQQVPQADGNTTLVAVMTDGTRVALPQRALPAARMDGNGAEAWHPLASPLNPQDEPFEVGLVGVPGTGPIPENIVGGDFTGKQPAFKQPTPEIDPHDEPTEQEILAMDSSAADFRDDNPHDTPYDMGGGTQGQIPENIVTGNGTPSSNMPGGQPPTPGPVGTGPVDAGSGQAYDWSHPGNNMPAGLPQEPGPVGVGPVVSSNSTPYDWTSGTIGEPADPAEELDASVARSAYDPESGETKDCDDDMAPTRDDNEEEMKLDLGLVEALDRTIVHTYKLAPENSEVRRLMLIARRQLTSLCGPPPSTKKDTDISRKLAELRKEVGSPDTSTVAGGLAFLRSAGTAPVGYRGLLDHDPELHITTPAERLAKEAVESDRRARTANAEADVAAGRVKQAQREAELNAVIRRNRKAV